MEFNRDKFLKGIPKEQRNGVITLCLIVGAIFLISVGVNIGRMIA